MTKISAYMITFNNERTVENALKSLHWADEIIVIDSFSNDKTPEIAQKYTTEFSQQKFLGFQKQYQRAAKECSNNWRFFLDADEEVTEELANSIKNAIDEQEKQPESERKFGFFGNRRNFYLGRWINYGSWKSDRELRLYHKNHGDWTPGLHSCLEVNGETETLDGFIHHFPYADISAQLATIDKYSSISAQDMLETGKKVSFTKLFFNPPFRFFRDYILKKGFRDGFAGFVIAGCTAFYVFIKQAKLYEARNLKA